MLICPPDESACKASKPCKLKELARGNCSEARSAQLAVISRLGKLTNYASSAEDLVQDAFETAWNKHQHGEIWWEHPKAARFSTYMYGVATNLWLNWEKKHREGVPITTDGGLGESHDDQEHGGKTPDPLIWKEYEPSRFDILKTRLEHLLKHHFQDSRCIEIFRAICDDSMPRDPQDLAAALGYSYTNFRKKKADCINNVQILARQLEEDE